MCVIQINEILIYEQLFLYEIWEIIQGLGLSLNLALTMLARDHQKLLPMLASGQQKWMNTLISCCEMWKKCKDFFYFGWNRWKKKEEGDFLFFIFLHLPYSILPKQVWVFHTFIFGCKIFRRISSSRTVELNNGN